MAWLAAHGIAIWDRSGIPSELNRGGGPPWSFHYLAKHDPDHLADRLDRLGLPADWRPSRVEAVDYGPSLAPETYPEWRAWRDRAGTS